MTSKKKISHPTQDLVLLEEIRVKTGLTNNDFAKFLGITQQAYYAWKRGENTTHFVIYALEAYNTMSIADLKWLVKERGLA